MNNQNKKYVSGKEASEILGIHQRTLYQWEEKGQIETIRTPGNKRLYNVEKFLMERNNIDDNKVNYEQYNEVEKLNIIYARVSTYGQKNDLERQIKELKDSYPNYILIEDIGSGMNLNRRGLRKIIDWAIDGKVNELIVTYKDRLARYGYELIEYIINKCSKGKIEILNKQKEKEPEEELVQDVLQIMNIFVARMNGLRRYGKIRGNEEN